MTVKHIAVNNLLSFADKGSMDFSAMIDIAKQVLLDRRVITVTVILLLYLALVNYVIRYKKKPPKIRRARPVAAAPATKSAEGQKGSGEESGDDADEKSTSKKSPAKSSAAKPPAQKAPAGK